MFGRFGLVSVVVFCAFLVGGAGSAEAFSFLPAQGSPFAAQTGGTFPASAAIGDFDGDTRPDFAVADADSNNVSVLLGDGSGGFTAATGSPVATGGTGSIFVAAGNFNGDTNLDLAVANQNSNTVSVLLGDGSGGFTAATGSPVATGDGSGPISVAVGNFNGDTNLDLAVANANSDTVSVLLGDGFGGFTATGSPVATGGLTPVSVAVGDFDGDGNLDLAAVNKSSDTVSVLLGNGSGGLAAATGSPFATGGSVAYSVAVGDFNGDTNPDVAVASEATHSVSVLLGDGSGGLAAATLLATRGADTRSVAVGDFNGDAKPDIAAANLASRDVSVFLGDGSGGFAAATLFATGGGGIFSMAVGDLNGDAKPDLAVVNFASRDVSVLLNATGSASLAPNPLDFGSQPVETIGPGKAITVSNAIRADGLVGRVRTGGANGGDFQISQDHCEGETISDTRPCTLEVRFQPSGTGTRTATLTVQTYDGTITSTLTGTGTASTGGGTGPAGPTGPLGPVGPAGPAGRDGRDSGSSRKSATYYCQRQGLRGRPLGQCVRALTHLTYNAQTTKITPRRACSVERKRATRRHRWSRKLYTRCVRAGTAFQRDLRS